jgi:hypothetical protein
MGLGRGAVLDPFEEDAEALDDRDLHPGRFDAFERGLGASFSARSVHTVATFPGRPADLAY